MVPRFEKLYAKKYPPDAYRKEVQGVLRVLQERYGLDPRRNRGTSEAEVEAAREPEQVRFRF
jgi:hypothetical protein